MAKLFPDSTDVKVTTKIAGRRGSLIWYPWRGRLCLRARPRTQSRASRRALDRWIAWLRVQNVLWLYSHWKIRVQCLEWERLSGIPARDWFMSHARGMLFSYVGPDGQEVFSVATRDRYSRSLDVFAQAYGSILWRDSDAWAGLAPGRDGQALILQGGRPTWADAGLSGGGAGFLPAEALYPYSASIVSLYVHMRAVRLPYATEGSGNLFLPALGRARLTISGWYTIPAGNTGTAILYCKWWIVGASGEPVAQATITNSYQVSDTTGHHERIEWALENIPSDAVGVSVALGRFGQNSGDTFPDYFYLLGAGWE